MAKLQDEDFEKVTAAFIALHGLTVVRGPFKGMRYVNDPSINVLTTKLLGIYECELYHTIEEQLIPERYGRIINVGCGDGYYAVGLALRMKRARVIAYDIKAAARRRCKQMAVLNGTIGRLTLESFCDTAALQEKVRRSNERKTLLFCDAEGYELKLLDPELVPSLRYCDMLVELHDFINNAIKPTILARFEKTHSATIIKSTCRERNPDDYPELQSLSEQDRPLCVSERRPAGMEWVVLKSNHR
ncbi:class I SAM-dependent methyltransferase [Paenibacillus mesophilus]|uniref:class I SAM-dependent methyltransferase n=1 Tax=Paenibacillus mesophilus TaxID=2582849 RepID=UPI00110E226D|nr:class I SAM-dependent methyltransferase [Paenibacillus mesophilus]TMV53023.1 class I SAM-dependent methyltransferase [Paenibacillus mesophilus]